MSLKDWKTYKLGELAEITSSKRIFYAEYVENGIPFYRSKEIINKFNKQEIQTELFISEKKYKEIKEKFGVPKIGDILLTSVGTLGIPFLVTDDAPFYFKDGNLTWFRKINSEKLDSYYLFIWLQSKEGIQKLKEITIGTTQPALTIAGLKEIEIVLPAIKTQKSIVKILSSLDDKIANNLAMNQTLEEIAQTIFKHWFVHFNYPEADGKRKQTELGEIPADWEVGKLGEYLINYDSKRIPVSSRERANRKGVYPYYGAASIIDYVDGYIFDGVYLLMGEDGTVITPDEKPVLQYVRGKFWVNNHAHVLQGRDYFTTEFLYLLLREKKIRHIVTGAVQPKINQENMNSLKIICPPKNIVNKFARLIKPLFEKILDNQAENQTLRQIRDGLLPKLMSGEIVV